MLQNARTQNARYDPVKRLIATKQNDSVKRLTPLSSSLLRVTLKIPYTVVTYVRRFLLYSFVELLLFTIKYNEFEEPPLQALEERV